MSNSTGDQLVSFFIYSLFIYPVTNYIVSPDRKYARWKAALYAVVFLFAVSTLHLMYESMEEGPNHYQLLGVTRNDGVSLIKRAYRTLSLEIHPDKNKSPTATEDFQRVKHAFDILVDKDKRREYNRLGEAGVHAASQLVIDHRHLLVQLGVHYGSSLVLAFIMTISEPTGEAFSLSLFGLAVMLLIEVLLVVQEIPLPRWFMPHHSAHEIVSTMHKLYPALMNGGRCISTAFYVDRKAVRVAALEEVANTTRALAVRAASLVRSSERMATRSSRVAARVAASATAENEDGLVSEVVDAFDEMNVGGVMEHALSAVRRQVASSKDSDAVNAMMNKKIELIQDPVALHNQSKVKDNRTFELFRNLGLYLLARFVFIKTSVSS